MAPLPEETITAIHEEIDKLPPHEAAVVRDAFGIDGDKSAAANVSEAGRRRIRTRAIRKLLDPK